MENDWLESRAKINIIIPTVHMKDKYNFTFVFTLCKVIFKNHPIISLKTTEYIRQLECRPEISVAEYKYRNALKITF